ncbi:MAG: amidohydrolase family protein [Dehalococcoidia bacterium]
MIIDFHTHIFPPHIRANRESYLARDHTFSHLYSDPKAKLNTAEDLIESMDANGVDVAVVLNMGWSEHEFCVETNDYIIESARRYPERLVPFCGVNPATGDDAVAEIERCAGLGARGIGELHSYAQGYKLDDIRVMGPVMEEAQRHNLIVLTHSSEPVGHIYPGKGTVTPEELCGFIQGFPEAIIVCAHWGGGLPFYALMPEVKEALRRVYFDTAASPFLYTPEVFPTVVECLGPDKILFGTDCPVITQKRLLDQIEGLGWPQGLKGQVLGGNARALLGL